VFGEKAPNILNQEEARSNALHDPYEFKDKPVSGILTFASTLEGKALTRRATGQKGAFTWC
jgi:hypothetical protein